LDPRSASVGYLTTSTSPATAPRLIEPRLAAIGVVGGVLSGLLGVGGGVVMVPLLVLWAGCGQRDAHAMSLGAIVPISVAGAVTYGVAGEVSYRDAVLLAVGAVAGSQLGARVLVRLTDRWLQLIFGAFLVTVAVAIGAGA
jgi:uncharacterized membrane protein YfcA